MTTRRFAILIALIIIAAWAHALWLVWHWPAR